MNKEIKAGTEVDSSTKVDATSVRQPCTKPIVIGRACRDAFKEQRTSFIKNNIDNVRRFVNNEMSKKERLVFSKIIRAKVGYSQKNNIVVIVRIFKNALEEIDLLKVLNEL